MANQRRSAKIGEKKHQRAASGESHLENNNRRGERLSNGIISGVAKA
jgi:hypothetical protein